MVAASSASQPTVLLRPEIVAEETGAKAGVVGAPGATVVLLREGSGVASQALVGVVLGVVAVGVVAVGVEGEAKLVEGAGADCKVCLTSSCFLLI